MLMILLDSLLFAMGKSFMADEQVTSMQSLADATRRYERAIPACERIVAF